MMTTTAGEEEAMIIPGNETIAGSQARYDPKTHRRWPMRLSISAALLPDESKSYRLIASVRHSSSLKFAHGAATSARGRPGTQGRGFARGSTRCE
jgi:hypothetical protein